MKNTLFMKTLAFTFMCLVYVVSFSQVSANTLVEPKPLKDSSIEMRLSEIQQQWQQALQSNAEPKVRFYELQLVAKKMFKLSLQDPSDARLQMWSGVMLSAFAGASMEGRGEHVAIFAKRMLEQAQQQQADILVGSHLDNGMSARSALQMALAYNPSGVDIDKYYGAFLNNDDSKMVAFNKESKIKDITHSLN